MGILNILLSNATGTASRNNNPFRVKEMLLKKAKTAPRARKAMSDRNPLQGLPTRRLPPGITIVKPCLKTGISKMLTIEAPIFVTSIFMGKEMVLIKTSGTGNMNKRNKSGKSTARVIFLPKRKSVAPRIRRNIETPEMEKIYRMVPKIWRSAAKTIIARPHREDSALIFPNSVLFCQTKNADTKGMIKP
jgi:predicted nucleotidyltransferase